MNSWKDTIDHILVKVFIFAHLVDFLPLLVGHLFFDCLSSHIITIKIFSTKLKATIQIKSQADNPEEARACDIALFETVLMAYSTNRGNCFIRTPNRDVSS